MKIHPQKRQLTLSVGELCRWLTETRSSTDSLSLVLRGKIGSETHRSYQEQRRTSSSYQHEVYINVNLGENHSVPPGWKVRIRGRLDGLIEKDDRAVIEEIKTVALPAPRFSELSPRQHPRHLRQLQIYLHLLAISKPDHAVSGKLVYINLLDGKVRAFAIPYQRDDIEPLIADVVCDIISRETRRRAEKSLKEQLAAHIVFPFEAYRAGQEEIISAVSECLSEGGELLLEAPTGLGKTAAVLFAALRFALRTGKQVLFLTAKTTQQDLVFQTAADTYANEDLPRVLLLRARRKTCPLPEINCHPDECPYLNDFHARFRRAAVREELLSRRTVHPGDIATLAEREKLCPHEIQTAIADEYDLIIGDYNYAFDPGCRLNSLFVDRDSSRLILIVDEAHNLPDRARSYFSVALKLDLLKEAQRQSASLNNSHFHGAFDALDSLFDYYLNEAPPEPDPYPIQLSLSQWEKILTDYEAAVKPYWYKLMEGGQPSREDPIIACFREAENFVRLMNYEGENFIHLVRRKPTVSLEITCLDAAEFLREVFSTVHSCIAMSATLAPFDFSRQRFGLDQRTRCLSLSNPFPPENQRIIIDPDVTTVYRHRAGSYPLIARKIERFHSLCHSRVLAFFPSFSFMQRVLDILDLDELYAQEEGMTDWQRNRLLEAFRRSDEGLLCSVLGGVFAEGIDLPGDLAQAAVIVGVGLPFLSTENEMLRAYYDRRGDNGFEYAYLVPGMQRVIQSVGRVIRSEEDRGLILLLDRRFTQPEYKRLLPEHWYQRSVSELIRQNWEPEVTNFSQQFLLKN